MSLDIYLRSPDCPTCGHTTELWHSNLTHNLGDMAAEAGLYEAVWRPDEHGIRHARQMLPVLRAGLRKLVRSPGKYRPMAAEYAGWGTYDRLVDVLKAYRAACVDYPDAEVHVSR